MNENDQYYRSPSEQPEKQYNYLFMGTSSDTLRINEMSRSLFEIFNNRDGKPNCNLLASLCIPEALLIKRTETEHIVYNLISCIESRQKILTNGTLIEFEEHEILGQNRILTNIAQRYSEYEKSGIIEGRKFRQKGHKFIQFVKTNEDWKICALIWEDERQFFL